MTEVVLRSIVDLKQDSCLRRMLKYKDGMASFMNYKIFYECAFCNLMWLRPVLRGQNVPEVTHPIHHTIYDSSGSTLRSLVVTIATAGPPEIDQLLGYVGIGVYFHENSALNISRSLPLTYRLRPISASPRSISPDLAAATEALKVVRTRVLPDRKRMIKELADLYRWTNEEIRAVSRFRLIIASSSVALIEGMTCSHPHCKFGRSSRDGTPGETNAFTRLMEQVEALSKAGIQVVWYLVDRQVSRRAKSLAKGAYTRHLLTPKGKKLPRVTEEHAEEERAPTFTEGSEDELKPTVRRSGMKRPVVTGQSNETLESLVLPEATLAAVS
ncbi:hypothetical protein D6D17_05094 [Aureobasidium pullulans]|nr:hypothetical protein D6D17_05094 [Aureobasidium pullulans]